MNAGQLVARLAELPLTIEDVAVERLERQLADGSMRYTAVVRLRGRNEEGVGEEVTFQPDNLLSPAPAASGRLLQDRVGWGTVRTLQELWAALGAADLFPRPPRWDVARRYRRWAVEAAALDLALRQAGSTLPERLELTPSPVRFVASPTAGWRGSLPSGVGLKLDATVVEPDLPVEIIDFKGAGDAELVGRVRELYPRALLEDPPVVPDAARVSWDIGVHSAADLDRLAPPAAVNVKPARVGSVPAVLALYETCAARGIAAYGGGQSELGPGRAQAQLLASLFHPAAPNDVAPTIFNEAPLSDSLPPSPLVVSPRPGFGLAD